jgi:hypothetical protein
MDQNTAIAAITRDAIAAIRALTSEAMTRLQGNASTSLVPMAQTDFSEVEKRAQENLSSPFVGLFDHLHQKADAPEASVNDVTSNVVLPNVVLPEDDQPEGEVEIIAECAAQEDALQEDDAPQDGYDADDDFFYTPANSEAPAEDQPKNALPIFDIAQNQIPDFDDEHFDGQQDEAVRAMCRLLVSAVMSRGATLAHVSKMISDASEGNAKAITKLDKAQSVVLYRILREKMLGENA